MPLQSQSTLERKKKTLSFSRKFPFMKSREDGKSEDGSDQERKFKQCPHFLSLLTVHTVTARESLLIHLNIINCSQTL